MNIKTEAIALAVRLLADHTSLIRRPDTFETALNSVFGVESYDRQIARNVEKEAQRVVDQIKRRRTDRKFRQITENI